MAKVLSIKNFKNIKGHIRIHDFTNVNYLVGPNGCGKSSIIDAISFLSNYDNSSHFFRGDSLIKIIVDEFSDSAIPDSSGNGMMGDGDAKIQIVPVSWVGISSQHLYLKTVFDYSKIGKDELEFLNETAEYLGFPSFTHVRLLDVDEWSPKVEFSFMEGDRRVSFSQLSGGFKAFNSLRYHVLNVLKKAFEKRVQLEVVVIVIEEPESNLHPNLQKVIPHFFDQIILELGNLFNKQIFFFITTHSPFVISGARLYANQKVYPIRDGYFLDKNDNLIPESYGFSGHESVAMVARMLGAEIPDLGFPENFCVLEEDSLRQILKPLSDSGVTRKIAYLSTSGWAKVQSYADVFEEMDYLTTVLKCNPMYDKTYLVIVDNVDSNKFSAAERGLINKMRKSMGDRLIMLSKHSLEDYYPNISKELHDRFQEEYALVEGYSKKGEKKGEFAKEIAALVTTREHFIKLFDGELNFLLKE